MKNKINKLNDIKLFLKKTLFKKKVPKNYLTLELLKNDKIDSMLIFRLIVMLENRYQIKINDNELFSNKFKNIKNISKLIEKKINAIKKKIKSGIKQKK